MIEVDRLTRHYPGHHGLPKAALSEVSFTVAKGEVLGLLGPNGAGKTTLSRILTTLLLPTSGTATVAGFDVIRFPRRVRHHIGLVLGGDRGLYGRLSARQNLDYWAALQGMNRRTARARITELICQLGLADRADDRVETFSRGMAQRVHLARALLSAPSVLVMDEPTNGMDPHAVVGFRGLIQQLRDQGTTVLLTTHDLHEAQQLCSRIALIDRGRLLRVGTPQKLLAAVRAPRVVTAARVAPAIVNSLAGIVGARVQSRDGQLTVHVDDDTVLATVLASLVAAQVTELTVAQPNLAEVYRGVIEDREFAL
ncbi:hypothetical protein GCM10010201_34240 [Pilimelia columellifera subsp. columellifera]|uniref:ABC transporter domain-containing protein n=2 Tax=Pilimelia TaxID=53370 RepID=A0ABN3NR48_9ACTN